MITKLQETTDWGDTPVTNGIYHVNDAGHLVGYETPKNGYKKFSKPMKGFSKARRTFEIVGTYEDEDEVSNAKTWKFEGSKGNIYVVTDEDGIIKCTCPGFTFRGKCKHSGEIIANGAGGQAPAWQ